MKFGKKVKITIFANGADEEMSGFGSPALKLTDENNLGITKSDSIDKGTVGILADKSAFDLKNSFREKLKNQNTRLKIIIEI